MRSDPDSVGELRVHPRRQAALDEGWRPAPHATQFASLGEGERKVLDAADPAQTSRARRNLDLGQR